MKIQLIAQGSQFVADVAPYGKLVIGGDGSSFNPVMRASKWDEESFFSFGLDSRHHVSPKFDGTTIDWFDTTDNIGLRIYAVDKHEFGAIEFAIILGSAPHHASRLEFPFEMGGLVCSKQHPLTQEEIQQGHVRPDDVINSHAFYHPTKVNGQRYRTGKAFHLDRWTATDADNRSIWLDTDVDIDIGRIRILFDHDTKSWFHKAKYPVTLGPTLGWTTAGLSFNDYSASSPEPYLAGNHWQSTVAAALSDFQFYTNTGGAPSEMTFAVFNSDGSTAGGFNSVGITAGGTSNSGGVGNWLTPRAITGSLASGSYYYLTVHGNSVHGGGTVPIYYDAVTGVPYSILQEAYVSGSLISPMPAMSSGTGTRYSMYVDYAGPPPTTPILTAISPSSTYVTTSYDQTATETLTGTLMGGSSPSVTVPSGWTATGLSVSGTTSATFSLTIPKTATAGSYNITFSTSDGTSNAVSMTLLAPAGGGGGAVGGEEVEYIPFGTTSKVNEIFIRNSDGSPKTGLTNASFTGSAYLSLRRVDEATPRVYQGANVLSITTLGTWADPAAGKIRIKEIDATTRKGAYEIQFENTVFAGSGADVKSALQWCGLTGVLDDKQSYVLLTPLKVGDPMSLTSPTYDAAKTAAAAGAAMALTTTERTTLTGVITATLSLPKNGIGQCIPFFMRDQTNLQNGITGTPTVTVAHDNAAFGATTGTWFAQGGGYGVFITGSSDLNGTLCRFKATLTGAVTVVIDVWTHT